MVPSLDPTAPRSRFRSMGDVAAAGHEGRNGNDELEASEASDQAVYLEQAVGKALDQAFHQALGQSLEKASDHALSHALDLAMGQDLALGFRRRARENLRAS